MNIIKISLNLEQGIEEDNDSNIYPHCGHVGLSRFLCIESENRSLIIPNDNVIFQFKIDRILLKEYTYLSVFPASVSSSRYLF